MMSSDKWRSGIVAAVLLALAAVAPVSVAAEPSIDDKLASLKALTEAADLMKQGKPIQAEEKLKTLIENGIKNNDDDAVMIGAALIGNVYLSAGALPKACHYWTQARDAEQRKAAKTGPTKEDEERLAKTQSIVKIACGTP